MLNVTFVVRAWSFSELVKCVNSPSSAIGITRDGKKTSRLLPAEGGQFRAVAPQPHSESAGGADTSPEGDPSRHRGQCRESGDADGRATPGRELELAAAIRGRNFPQPDGQPTEFTVVAKKPGWRGPSFGPLSGR